MSGAAQMHADEEAGSTLEAYGLADFVLHTLNNEEQKEKAGRPGSSGAAGGEEAEQAVVEGVLARETPVRMPMPRGVWRPPCHAPCILSSCVGTPPRCPR